MQALLSFALALCLLAFAVQAAEAPASLYDVPLKNIDGQDTTLKPYQGKVLLIVNVASKCGYTPQYSALQAIYQKYQGQGFVVLGFPCNQFAGQEPGSDADIKQFCSSKYNVTFPLFDKIDVNGDDRSPLYTLLTGKTSPASGPIAWNFTKFLISRDGKILKRFEPRVKPDSEEVTHAIEAALATK